MKKVIYNHIVCYIYHQNGDYLTLQEIDTGTFHLSINIKDIIYASS